MLDIKRIRENPDELLRAMQNRRFTGVDVAAFLETDAKRRALVTEVEALKARRNEVNERISAIKREGKDAQHLMADMKEAGAAIKAMDAQIGKLDEEIQNTLLRIPNIPHESTPAGEDETANIELRRHGEPPRFSFEPKPHWELGEALDVLDFAMGGKVTGARFTFYKGLGARLERAVINFFLDIHSCENGYTEVFPPFLANAASMTGTGQLPKFAEDVFKVEGTDYYLVPTAEVPVTNMYRDSVLQGEQLPIRHCAYSACFRAEAGSAGRDTRGLIRQHQFNKVELVRFTTPETSYEALESLAKDAELVLQRLGLPYRVVALSTGDLGFSAAKTYDLEVWMPSYGRYLEISSCSNFEDFQARRANIRFRREKKAKLEYVHTLNGSGLAVGRTVAAIFENYQQPDGSVKIPKVLVPYMGANIIERG